MKTYALILSFVFAGQLYAAAKPPHMDLDMSTEEYRLWLKKMKHGNSKSRLTIDDPSITEAIRYGERLSKWIALINTGRSAETAIRLTSKDTRPRYPIEKPNSYNPTIIKLATDKAMADLPSEMRTTLTASDELKGTLSLDDATFIKHARIVDKNYQSAVRYKGNLPWKNYYKQAAASDVRGYYYLKTNKIGTEALKDSTKIPADKIPAIKDALAKICFNAAVNPISLCQSANPENVDKCDIVAQSALDKCKTLVEESFKKNSLDAVYNEYFAIAASNWNDFFAIPAYAPRKDFTWTDAIMTVVFNTPEYPKFIPYLQNNIEDEYKFGDWRLKMVFGSYPTGPHLTFKAGETPHVNGLGGDEIVMDSNQPIEEYESGWTIRHEFGHVLGFPDCYHEFYDLNQDAFVNYQLDITDLMCSRAGNMKERIFTELKRVYKK